MGKINNNPHISKQVPETCSMNFTDRGSGGCRALDKNSEMLPSCRVLICRHKDCKGVLKSSGI